MNENPSCSFPRASRTVCPDISVSFEFFPPANEAMEATLWESIKRLAPLGPSFVSVTYGAGGSTRERTHATVARIVNETSVKPAAHLTCVAAAREEIDAVVRGYWDIGVRHIVALRGDPQGGPGTKFCPHPNGYADSATLVAGIRRVADFEVSVSTYPEGHPESVSADADIDVLKTKIDAGASRAITQFFFENENYLRFVEKVRGRGIDIPIVPGIVPVQSFKRTAKFASRAGAAIPQWLADRFDGLDDDPQTRKLVAATVAAEQVLDLVDHGVRDFHFYTMNRADLVYAFDGCHTPCEGIDIEFANADGTVSGQGIQVSMEGTRPLDVVVGDFNNDSIMDLAAPVTSGVSRDFSHNIPNGIAIWTGKGGRTGFNDPIYSPLPDNADPFVIAAGFIDADHNKDIVTLNRNGTIAAFLNSVRVNPYNISAQQSKVLTSGSYYVNSFAGGASIGPGAAVWVGAPRAGKSTSASTTPICWR
jgi:methylenetetrahydrofolate reductase (NADPH)